MAAADRPLTESGLLTDLTALRRRVGHFAAAVAETVRLRRRAVLKLGPIASEWLFTDEALQQATPAQVAAHRAIRLSGLGVHDLTCSIGADLAALMPVCAPALGSDLDPVRIRMAAHNLRTAGLPDRVLVADALRRTSRGLLGYADPARRESSGRRITSMQTFPSVADLDDAHSARPPVLRLPPGIDYERLGRPGEVEIVSLDGGAREAVLWPQELATVARRATVLSHDGSVYAITSDDPDDAPAGPAPGRTVGNWLVDPDAAVVRAHLVRHYATRHRLTQIDPHLAYLVGPEPPAATRAFRILDAAPYTIAGVTHWIRRDGTGTLEIKQRGTPVVPDDLRRRLRSVMSKDTTVNHTLVLARIGDQPWAFWCRATAAVGPA
jgi:hypothetical protein